MSISSVDCPREPGESAGGEMRRLFLHAGHLWVSREPAEITTILGSCVAICLWDRVSGVGGMNHYMLPHDVGTEYASPRYARYATRALLEQLGQAGANLYRLRAKVYGGACTLGNAMQSERDLGRQNARVARELLLAEHIPVVDEQTGGNQGLKVIFETATGHAAVMKVQRVIG